MYKQIPSKLREISDKRHSLLTGGSTVQCLKLTLKPSANGVVKDTVKSCL